MQIVPRILFCPRCFSREFIGLSKPPRDSELVVCAECCLDLGRYGALPEEPIQPDTEIAGLEARVAQIASPPSAAPAGE